MDRVDGASGRGVRIAGARVGVGAMLLPVALAFACSPGGAPPAGRWAVEEACVVRGEASSAARERALADCRFARERFALLFGEDAPGADVELTDTASFAVSWATDRVRLQWYAEALTAGFPETGEALRRMVEEDRVITHELLHIFFWLRSGDPTDIETRTQYGTRRPDWFDEGIAVWGEREAMRVRRWEQLAALPDSVLSLRAIAAERHPGLADPPGGEGLTAVTIEYGFRCLVADCRGVSSRPPEGFAVRRRTFANGETVVDTVPESQVGRSGPLAASFYPVSYGLVRYLHARGGPDAIQEIVRRFAGGWPGADSVFADVPGLPPGLDAVEADWRRWIRSTGPG